MTKAKIVKASDGIYEVHFPEGGSRWFYTKAEAEAVKKSYDTKGKAFDRETAKTTFKLP